MVEQQQAASALVILVAMAGWWRLYYAWREYQREQKMK